MSWKEHEDSIDNGPIGLAKVVFIIALLGGLVYFAVGAIFKPAALVGEVTKVNKIIYNYEYFYNKSESYRAIKTKIRTANKSVANFKEDAGPRAEWSFEDKTEMSRLRSIADGLVYQCNDIVADYNAKSKQVTRSIFKTDATPHQLQECQ